MTVQYTVKKQNHIFSLPEGMGMGKELTPFWEKTFDELKTILLTWLQDSRAVWVFSIDDPFISPADPLRCADYFQLEGHDILIVCPEDLTITFLHAAFFYTYPVNIFKTKSENQYIKNVFKKSILPKEQRLRDSDFNIRILFDSFGKFITVLGMSDLYIVDGQDIYQIKL